MRTREELANAVDPFRQRVAGAFRRMAVRLTTKVLWQLTGYEVDGQVETTRAEPFTGIGVYARPPASGSPEAIVVMIQDSKAPMIVAVRDEATRAAIAGALKAGETMLYTDKVFVHLTAAEVVEVSKPGYDTDWVALRRDLTALKTAIQNAVIVANDGGASFKSTLLSALTYWPDGSNTLKAGVP